MKYCSGCGRRFAKGAVSWNMLVRIWANYDGDIGFAGQTEAEIDESIEKMLERIQHIDARTLENEIHQEFRFRLCKDCRDRFVANPLNVPLNFKKKKDSNH